MLFIISCFIHLTFHIGRSILPTYKYNPLCLAEKCCKAMSVVPRPICAGDRKAWARESKGGTLGVDVRKSAKLKLILNINQIFMCVYVQYLNFTQYKSTCTYIPGFILGKPLCISIAGPIPIIL